MTLTAFQRELIRREAQRIKEARMNEAALSPDQVENIFLVVMALLAAIVVGLAAIDGYLDL
jgi:hypothetical protein